MNANNAEALRPRAGKNAPSLKGVRIVVLLKSLELGGSERQALLFSRRLRNEHHANVEIWGHKRSDRIVELCEEYGIPWRLVLIPLPWSKSRLRQLKRLIRFAWTLRRARPDVILPYTFFPSLVCSLVWRLTGAQVCIWNQRGDERDRLGGRPERLAVRLTPAFIANSQFAADFLTCALGAGPNQVRVVRDGVELDPPEMDRTMWRRQLEVAAGCFLACMVANLTRSKDHATLLKAWRIVIDRLEAIGQKAVLVLAGRFDETHELLKATAYDLELFDSVRFLGEVKDISGLAGAADLCVHSSASESIPSGVLECMAAGLAVAGTDSIGMRESVGPKGYSLLAAPGNAEELADRIVRLALDPAWRSEVGTANSQRITTHFGSSRMCEEMLAVIANGLRQREREIEGGSQ